MSVSINIWTNHGFRRNSCVFHNRESKSSASTSPTALDRASAQYRGRAIALSPSQGALKAIKRQIVPVDAFGNRKPRLRGWLHVVLCGIDYSNIFLIIAGAVCFALRKPNPVPGWFEFHEGFHLGTVIGYACHVVAIYLIACAL